MTNRLIHHPRGRALPAGDARPGCLMPPFPGSLGYVACAWRDEARVRQAESSVRPLRRRAERMDRPARVRIRRRKPCVFARRRLFGWKVRLLIDQLRSLVRNSDLTNMNPKIHMPPVWTHPVCTDAMTAPVSPPHTNAHIHERGHTAESDETSAGQRYGHLPQRVKPSSQQTCSSLAEIADSAESLIIAHQGQKNSERHADDTQVVAEYPHSLWTTA